MYDFDSERVEKLEQLKQMGIMPYPHGLSVTHTANQVHELIGERDNDALADDETEVCVAGRLMFKNEMGKAGFARIQDDSGRVQVYVRKNMVGEDAFAGWKKLDLGDHVHVTGRLMRTRTGESTVKASAIVLAAKCIRSLPDKHKGLTDPEFRNRHRYVDLFMNEESRDTFRKRAQIVGGIRDFFQTRGFMEVETPMMQTIPGGAAARPFVTHHNALDMDLYMRIAPELYLKRLVVGGFHRVFEVNRNFRNEGISAQHNPEFTMLEFYWAYANWHDMMDMTEELVSNLAQDVCGGTTVEYGEHALDFSRPWARVSMADAIAEAVGLSSTDVVKPEMLKQRWLADHPKDTDSEDLPVTMGKWFQRFFDHYVEPGLIQPTFITDFPTEISPLSRRNDNNPETVERFELFVAGKEIANGFNELNDPVDQAQRFAAQVEARDSGDDEAMFFDSDYVEALSYGMPPTAGEGIGVDRLVMLLTNRQSIRDVILFPTLRRLGES